MLPKRIAPFIFFLGGFAALSWQVLWQMDLSLALGVSAKGTALTVATVMAGMTLGALWAGKKFEISPPENPWRLYGLLELAVGLFAWLPRVLLPVIESADAAIYNSVPFLATPFSAIVLALTIGPSCFAMGATLPVIGILAKQSGALLSRFYAANTVGAAIGALGIAFFLMPALGRAGSGIILVLIQLGILAAVWKMQTAQTGPAESNDEKTGEKKHPPVPPRTALIFAAVTGFTAFMLEVAWFRILRSSWLSTTDSFAIMLFVFLVSLAIGAWFSKRLRKFGVSLAVMITLSGMAVLIATPLLERFDLWGTAATGSYFVRALLRVIAAFVVMGPPVILLGLSLPWLLDEAEKPRDWAKIYGINTIGAVVGSLITGWFLMNTLGPVKTCWLAAIILAGVGIFHVRAWRGRFELLVPTLMLLAVAWWADSGIGEKRIQGPTKSLRKGAKLVANVNGPDSTTSVVRVDDGSNVLFIDGYAATGEYGEISQYMDAMGRLPMLLHDNPQDALVICFGTGQTARAVLDENPARLTCVDVNRAVFQLADHFKSNRDVLKDDRVRVRVMDGRAWLRRTTDLYDVVTLEPMPPFFAGVNSLYSVEFYELIASRTREDGYVAQWFPIHLMTPEHARAVAAAFVAVFPKSILWFDPNNADANGVPQQGILIGRKGENEWNYWPGFQRPVQSPRPLTYDQVSNNVLLTDDLLKEYTAGIQPVTDNNRLLSYGKESLQRLDLSRRMVAMENMAEIFKLKQAVDE